MSQYNNREENNVLMSTFYHRDPSVPYWRSNVDVDSLFAAHAHRPERAQAWLRYRKVSESCFGFQQAVMMNGHFEGGILGNHKFHWTFTPGRRGDIAIVLPVFNEYRLADFVAISRHDHEIWGCCTGAGQFVGDITTPLRVHRAPANWLANDCDGILPLSKTFFPQLQNASRIIAEDDDHAWDLAQRVFIDPAAKFGRDEGEAEERAYKQIEIAA
jgi:hypothetical protein